MWMGLVFYIGVIWFFLLFICMFWIYYERIVFAEEVFLRKKFSYAHPEKSFNWKKIVVKEKSTILMFFLAFFVLQQFSNLFEVNTMRIEHSQITYGFLTSVTLYILIKSLQVLRVLSAE